MLSTQLLTAVNAKPESGKRWKGESEREDTNPRMWFLSEHGNASRQGKIESQ